MHRSIHKLWGFGQLEDWDEKSSSSPFNNMNLMTNLELVLNRDGTVDKVVVVQSSGYLPYDAVAIDVAYSAGPYPDPPKAIRSPNGKIYVHWRFYRDERQCATSGVDYFILDDGKRPADDPDDRPAMASASSPATPQPLPAATRANSGTTTPAVATPGAPPTTGGNGGLRRLERFDDSQHSAGMKRLDAAVAAAEQQEGATPVAPGPAGQGSGAAARRSTAAAEASRQAAPKAADPIARAVAKRWFAALAAGNATALADTAAFPFKTSDKDVTTRANLAAMLGELASEGTPKADSVQIFTAAGLRAAIGKLPPNLDDSTGAHLYAVASNGPEDTLILVLSEQPGGWKANGLVRR
jgi:TonB family protein